MKDFYTIMREKVFHTVSVVFAPLFISFAEPPRISPMDAAQVWVLNHPVDGYSVTCLACRSNPDLITSRLDFSSPYIVGLSVFLSIEPTA